MILRSFVEDDAIPLAHILGEPDVLRYFPNTAPPSRERVQKMIAAQLNHWKAHAYGWWAMELRSTHEFAGWSGLQFLPETQETEVGYLLVLL